MPEIALDEVKIRDDQGPELDSVCGLMTAWHPAQCRCAGAVHAQSELYDDYRRANTMIITNDCFRCFGWGGMAGLPKPFAVHHALSNALQ